VTDKLLAAAGVGAAITLMVLMLNATHADPPRAVSDNRVHQHQYAAPRYVRPQYRVSAEFPQMETASAARRGSPFLRGGGSFRPGSSVCIGVSIVRRK
jgi:hypothetical protein